MYNDINQWLKIRHRILMQGIPRKQVARETGIGLHTVRKMLRHPLPIPAAPREIAFPKLGPYRDTIDHLLQERANQRDTRHPSAQWIYEHIRALGYTGSYNAVQSYVADRRNPARELWEAAYDHVRTLDRLSAVSFLVHVACQAPLLNAKRTIAQPRAGADPIQPAPSAHQGKAADRNAFIWMLRMLQKNISDSVLRRELSDMPDLDLLLDNLYEGRLSERNRCLAVLANRRGWPIRAICSFLCIDRKTCGTYLRTFRQGGVAALLKRRASPNRKLDSEALKNLIFKTLHEPPMNYGFGRTSWTMAMLSQVLADKGQPACRDTVRKITHQAGWRWRKAREVLTSSDPEYAEKLQRVQSILSNLQSDEAFFSIDEFGPFAVKMKGGRALTPPGEVRTVPQWQKSRGSLIVTAALELSSNQITHFYSEKKNTAGMIRMAETLLKAYSGYRVLYLSWDAASWHTSRELNDWIARHNGSARATGDPTFTTVPLPSSAQFLNVIESVFSGMARAVTHNSDYAGLDEARVAIDRYFAERNAHFQSSPKRAGDKIWKSERVAARFSEANNCKDPDYR